MNVPLSDEAIREQVFAIVATQTKVDPSVLRPEATLKDLGVASLEAIELIFDLEEHFGITFPEDRADFDTDTLQQLIDAVQGALARSGGSEAA
jgi:acyl carrier protein